MIHDDKYKHHRFRLVVKISLGAQEISKFVEFEMDIYLIKHIKLEKVNILDKIYLTYILGIYQLFKYLVRVFI